jgi:hypothetical protein
MILLVASTVVSSTFAAGATRAVVVNEVRLSDQSVATLEQTYRTVIPDGRYWYDARSGLWGRQGGPTLGQIPAGLKLGRLHAQASGGSTGVFVNGRRLPRAELDALQQLVGTVRPGRYWLDALGNAGLEDGPPLVNLIDAYRARNRGDRVGWNRNTPGGSWGGDDRCSYYSHPDGPSVMIGNC